MTQPITPDGLCQIPGCRRKHFSHTWCRMHYQRWYKWGDPLFTTKVDRPKECSFPTCDEVHFGLGYCQTHYSNFKQRGAPERFAGWNKLSELDDFLDRVDQDGPIPSPGLGECWIWCGSIGQRYNAFFKGTTARRWIYQYKVGDVRPTESVIADCGTDLCVKPDHLIALQPGSRTTHCPWGHEYTPENTLMTSGHRTCRTCTRAAHHIRRSVFTDGDRISIDDLYDRDNGECQICHKPIDRDLNMRDSLMKSIDHIIPIAKGGAHVWGNVQIAHLDCNRRKGAKLLETTNGQR